MHHSCEDHFNLREDLQNYYEWKLMGAKKILKDDVVPRVTCNTSTTKPLKSTLKELNIQTDCAENVLASSSSFPQPPNLLPSCKDFSMISTTSADVMNINTSNAFYEPTQSIDSEHKPSIVSIDWLDLKNISSSNTYEFNKNLYTCKSHSPIIESASNCTPHEKQVHDVGVQIHPDSLVKSTQTLQERRQYVQTRNVGINCNIIPNNVCYKMERSVAEKAEEKAKINDTIDSLSSMALDSSASYVPNSEKKSDTSEEKNLQREIFIKNVYENQTRIMIEHDPLKLIGIQKDCMYLISILQNKAFLSVRNIYLTLKKIRLNESFLVLSYQFGLSARQVGKIFKETLNILSKNLKSFVAWPSKQDILLNLPIQFRYRYHNVQSIIDCFEIEIEKPSDPVKQSLTWSEYKKCNTSKYLISVTPDGFINYISEGYCRRCSDMEIVEGCGYLDILPPKCSLLADRGFKQLDSLLHKKQCTLVRPPSVNADTKCSPKEVRLIKQIASIRIHVERVINRMRNSEFLNIHSRVDKNLMDSLDFCVVVAAAVVNIQIGIIKDF